MVELLRILRSQIGCKLDKDAQRPEDSRNEEEDQGQRSPEWILFKTLQRLPTIDPTALSSNGSFEGINTRNNGSQVEIIPSL